MKILMPYISHGGQNIESSVITGGIEKFNKNIYNMFIDEIIPIEITKTDRKSRNTKNIIDMSIQKHKPDFMLISENDLNFLSYQIDSGIPTITVVHKPLISAIWYLPIFENLPKFVDAGGHLYFVSDNQYNFFNAGVNRITGSKLNNFNGLINSSFCSGDELVSKDIIYDAITIGRTEELKDPFFIHRKIQNTELNSCVITTKDDNNTISKNVSYFDINLNKWEEPQFTFRGISYEETMLKLSQAGCYISTCTCESWGITVLEALSRGVPVIIVADKSGKHSSREIAASEDHYRIVNKSIKPQDLVNIIKELSGFSYEKRLEISRMTKEKHSKEKYKITLDKIFETRLNDVSPRQESILESFFQ